MPPCTQSRMTFSRRTLPHAATLHRTAPHHTIPPGLAPPTQAYALTSVGGSDACRVAIAEGHAAIGTMLNSTAGRSALAKLFPVWKVSSSGSLCGVWRDLRTLVRSGEVQWELVRDLAGSGGICQSLPRDLLPLRIRSSLDPHEIPMRAPPDPDESPTRFPRDPSHEIIPQDPSHEIIPTRSPRDPHEIHPTRSIPRDPSHEIHPTRSHNRVCAPPAPARSLPRHGSRVALISASLRVRG
jgi:hypothetical protein